MPREPLSHRVRNLAALGLCLGLAACGGAAAPARSPEVAPESTHAPAADMTELDALERDFDVSVEQLAVQLQRREAETRTNRQSASEDDLESAKKEEGAGAPPRPAPPASGAAPAPAPAQEPAGEANAPPAQYHSVGSACDLMCRALASMERSAGGICSLAGEEHQRCRKARLRLALSEEQVRGAGCACSR